MNNVYAFEQIGDELDLLPLAARRALDRAGRKLSLETWRTLSSETRQAIVTAGAQEKVDAGSMSATLAAANVATTPVEMTDDPSAEVPPADVVEALGAARPMTATTWKSLSSLDRFVLASLAARRRANSMARAFDE
ncbi:MAG: nitrate reductase associated protein, partial [Deltaproteobacteria bacterium]